MGSDSLARQEIDLRSKWLSEWTGQVTRVEPATGSTTGVPDTFLINAKSAGWLEFKVVGNGGTFEIRTPQRRWHRHFMEYSTASGFCILSTQGFWLINSRAAIEGQHVVGDCLPWKAAVPHVLTFAMNRIWAGKDFNKQLLDDMIEPKHSGVDHGQRQEEMQGNLPKRRAAGTLQLRS